MATAGEGAAASSDRAESAGGAVRWGSSMDSDPVVVVIPHRHGKAEATRRIKAGLEDALCRQAEGRRGKVGG
jgi:hypothetical protein